MNEVKLANFTIGPQSPLTVFCGPCVIESESFVLELAGELKKIFRKHPFQFVFKASYDKANRSSIESFRGPGLKKGVQILQKVREELSIPIVTDAHTPEEATTVGNLLDCVQIPAFLSRQTDLLIAAAKTPATVKVKKGQFLAPWDMKNVVDKLVSSGKKDIILTDRGTCFGYNNLVSDMRAIPIMQNLGYPVCFDATHSLQLPGGLGESTGGMRQYTSTLARAALAAGANALFIEVHPNPPQSKSDATTVLSLEELKTLLIQAEKLYDALRCFSDSPLSLSH